MSQLTQKEINTLSQKILKDYDSNNPSIIFKNKIKISNTDAQILQKTVSKLRKKEVKRLLGIK